MYNFIGKKISEKEKQRIIDNYHKSKEFHIVNLYTQAIHQMLNIQLSYFDRIKEYAGKHGIVKNKMKQCLNMAENQFNLFELELRKQQKVQITKEQKTAFLKEFEDLEKKLTKYFLIGDEKDEKDND